MAMIGMDVEAVRQHATQLNGQADQIEHIINAINGLVGQIEGAWQGNDAREFKSQWEGTHRTALHNAEQMIRELVHTANAQASQQEQASSNY